MFFKNWSIPEAEIKRRRDFRSECVFTIDPLTARDLDDALSVTKEADGNYRLVRANSAGSANNINAIDLCGYIRVFVVLFNFISGADTSDSKSIKNRFIKANF